MYQIYLITIIDYMGQEQSIKLRGALQSTNANAQIVLDSIVSDIQGVINGHILYSAHGVEQVFAPSSPANNSTVDLNLKCGYTDGNGNEKSLLIPCPDVSIIDFLQGDLVKLNKQPIKSMLDTIEDEALDFANGTGISFDYVVLIGNT